LTRIRNVDLLLTFKCTSECRHCAYRGGPTRTEMMDSERAKQWLQELADLGYLETLTVHGGEPFINFRLLREVVAYARILELAQIGVITNGFWAKDTDEADKKLGLLKKEGLTQITFSLDAFHQEFISLEKVRNGVISASSMGFDNVWVDSYFIGGIETENPHNNATRKAIDYLGDIDDVEFSPYVVDLEGRAVDFLTEQVELKEVLPSGRCVPPFWIPGGLQNPATIEIDSEGNVTLCPGLCIGNATESTLTDIVTEYDYRNHPIISRIEESGPASLIELARHHGLAQIEKYLNECHVCYEMRRFLQPFYPEFLAPLGCYQGK